MSALLFLFPALALATNPITWSTSLFLYHGETPPSLTPYAPPSSSASSASSFALTPESATSLISAGALLRARYISPPVNGSLLTVAAVIDGIPINEIDNSLMDVWSTDEEVSSASAMALFQGLYPPVGEQSVLSGLGDLISESLDSVSNGSTGLAGYQYPNVETFGSEDWDYIWLAGNEGCTNYDISVSESTSLSSYKSTLAETDSFYQSLASSVFSPLDPSLLHYGNAKLLYDYALYAYAYNASVASSLSTSDLAQLSSLASSHELLATTNSTNVTSIQSIAGQTLTAKVLQGMQKSISSSGVSAKLNILIGSYEPFLSFFSLADLPSHSPQFSTLPLYGSIMGFELYSYTTTTTSSSSSSSSSTFPPPLRSVHPLQFMGYIGDAGLSLDDLGTWCTVCGTSNLWCLGLEANQEQVDKDEGGKSSKAPMNPVIAGVIGAAVTIGVVLLLILALLLLGFRLRWSGTSTRAGGNEGVAVLKRNSAGGFKGREKLHSDTDLALKTDKGATVRHERVGSWELSVPKQGHSLDKEISGAAVRSQADYSRESEDGIAGVDLFGEGQLGVGANYGGHYAAEASSRLRQTSAPPSSTPLDPHYVNPYQQAMDPHGSGPEPSTKMVQDYKGYKYDDYDLEDAESSVKAIYRAGGPVGPKGNKSTIEGHGRVAEIANRGIQNLRDTRWGRTEMTKDYVGYDDKESAGGHERHIRYLGGRENKLVKKRDLSAKLSGTSEEEEEDDPRVKGKGQVIMKVMEEEEEVHKPTITRRSSDIKWDYIRGFDYLI
ncbi:hypothetical protein B7494_g3076 [Chlorociboria aeruginascens]|nr:hypothetical protein B7494_g3076 [Chlorociboria aeruginascens]